MAIRPDTPAWVVERENKRRALYFALRSRVLSVDEMQEVEAHDFHLTVEMNQSYNQSEKRAEFNDALLQQFRLRLQAQRSNPTVYTSAVDDEIYTRKCGRCGAVIPITAKDCNE